MSEIRFLTSGSTGEPKEIVRDAAQILADVRALLSLFPAFARASRFIGSVSRSHLFGTIWMDMLPHEAAVEVEDGQVLTVEELLEKAVDNCVFITTPSFLEKAVRHPDFIKLNGRFTDVVVSGGPLRNETSLEVKRQLGMCPLEIYGSTEAGTVGWHRADEGRTVNLFEGVEADVNSEGLLVVRSPFAATNPLIMPDKVRFVSPLRFELLGRADRLVKVNEEFVSLTKVENALKTHRYVRDSRAETYSSGVERVGALVVLNEDGNAALAKGTYAEIIGELRESVKPQLSSLSMPRRIRFVRELPVNERGKTTVKAVKDILNGIFREPAVLKYSATGSKLEMEFVLPPDNECFKGHFPGFPILPGVAQLMLVQHFAKEAFADFPCAVKYSKLKFRRLVKPAELMRMDVSRSAGGGFQFVIAVGDEIAASGCVAEVGEK